MRAMLGTYYSRSLAPFVSKVMMRLPVNQSHPKQVCFTFDDGPTDGGTPELLNVLDRYQIKATFFLVGQQALKFPNRVREIIAAGHTIGNHTFSHADGWTTSRNAMFAELFRCTQTLEQMTSSRVAWMRPPYGRLTSPMVQWCQRAGQHMTMWDVMPPDFEAMTTPAQVAVKLQHWVRPGSIVCLHDNHNSQFVTPRSLLYTIPRLINAGWEFTNLDQVQLN